MIRFSMCLCLVALCLTDKAMSQAPIPKSTTQKIAPVATSPIYGLIDPTRPTPAPQIRTVVQPVYVPVQPVYLVPTFPAFGRSVGFRGRRTVFFPGNTGGFSPFVSQRGNIPVLRSSVPTPGSSIPVLRSSVPTPGSTIATPGVGIGIPRR